MLDQEDYTELDDKWLNADERLTYFIKTREWITGSVK